MSPGRPREAALLVGLAWGTLAAVVGATPAGASPAPLSGRQVFAQREVVSPLVTAVAVDNFAAFDGTDLDGWLETTGLAWTVHLGAMRLQTGAVELDAAPRGVATLATAFSGVLIRADLELPEADRATGVVVDRGPAGSFHVVVERDGADQRVALYLDDGASTTLLEASTPSGGLPSTVHLVVESVDDVLRVWLDGTLTLTRSLTGLEATIADQQEHGLVLGHPADRVAGFLVLAPT
jgi:hypothetical protein